MTYTRLILLFVRVAGEVFGTNTAELTVPSTEKITTLVIGVAAYNHAADCCCSDVSRYVVGLSEYYRSGKSTCTPFCLLEVPERRCSRCSVIFGVDDKTE